MFVLMVRSESKISPYRFGLCAFRISCMVFCLFILCLSPEALVVMDV